MKIELLQENLTKGLSVVSRSVSTKATMPVLSHVLISATKQGVFLSSTNLETGVKFLVPAKVIEEGTLTVPARIILEYCVSLPAGKMALSSEGGQLLVNSGGFEAKIDGMSASEFPKLPTFPKNNLITFTKSDFVKAMSLVGFSAAVDEGRPVLTGVKTVVSSSGVVFAATDGYRLSVLNLKTDRKIEGELSMIIPSRSMVEVARVLADVEEKTAVVFSLTEEKNQAVFLVGNVELSTRLIEGSFPNFEKIIPSAFSVNAEVSKEGLLKAVRAASVFAKDSANIIKLGFEDSGRIVVSANAPQVGSNVAVVEAKVKGKNVEIAFNSRFLVEFLANAGADLVEFATEGSLNPGVFKLAGQPEYLHIIMPVRVQ